MGPEITDVLPDDLKNGQKPLEHRFLTTHQDGQLSCPRAFVSTRDRCIQTVNLPFVCRFDNLPADLQIVRAEVDPC